MNPEENNDRTATEAEREEEFYSWWDTDAALAIARGVEIFLLLAGIALVAYATR